MSNRKKSKAAALQNATGYTKSSQHITRITAKSSRNPESKSTHAKPVPASHSASETADAQANNNTNTKASSSTQPHTSHSEPSTDTYRKDSAKVNTSSIDQPPEAELVVTNTGETELQPVDKADRELNTPKKLTRAERKALKKSQKSDEERPIKSYFILLRPFVCFGRYLRDSWREIRQVRWPNRAATWKMTIAVLVYCALFFLFLLLIDTFFTFIFDLLFK